MTSVAEEMRLNRSVVRGREGGREGGGEGGRGGGGEGGDGDSLSLSDVAVQCRDSARTAGLHDTHYVLVTVQQNY